MPVETLAVAGLSEKDTLFPMGKQYNNSPLIEVLCDFGFASDSPWIATYPGLIFTRVKDRFPISEPASNLLNDLQINDPTHAVNPEITAFLFQEGKQVLLQVGPNHLVVNHLKPYTHWADFSPSILYGYSNYVEVAKPRILDYVMLRYINRIEISSRDLSLIDMNELFNVVAAYGEELGAFNQGFIVGLRFPGADGKSNVKVQLATLETPDLEVSTFLLDISYYSNKPGEVEQLNVEEWINVAHKRLSGVFEAVITDKLRVLLEVEG